jgi:Fic family protein
MKQKKRIVYKDVDDRTEELSDLAGSHPDLFGEFLRRFELSWIYHENALEGIVVTHAELTTALKGRPIAPDTYMAIRNLKMAVDMTRRTAALEQPPAIDMELVKRLHAAVSNDDAAGQFEPGVYRKFIPLHRTYFHDIAQPASIAPRMTRLLDWAQANDPSDEEAVKFAAHFHHEFMSIFPFPKHTGKVGRLLVNYILMRHGYIPVIFHASERQRYYETLRHTPKTTEAFLSEMMINCIENASKFIEHSLVEREKREFRAKAAS